LIPIRLLSILLATIPTGALRRFSGKVSLKLELRFEFYNLLNHPNFANPLWPNFLSDPTVSSTCGTTPNCANSIGSNGRLVGYLPITTTADVGPGYPFLGGGGPRSIQLAAKFSF
jgi:hypothetical protein